MKDLHLNVWSKDETLWDVDEGVEEVSLRHTDTYPNMSGPDYPSDGYHQFGGHLKDGRWLELRIPLDHELRDDKE